MRLSSVQLTDGSNAAHGIASGYTTAGRREDRCMVRASAILTNGRLATYSGRLLLGAVHLFGCLLAYSPFVAILPNLGATARG